MTGLTRALAGEALRGVPPLQNTLFWPLVATKVATSGQKRRGAREPPREYPTSLALPPGKSCK
jgi:hypothetical protein